MKAKTIKQDCFGCPCSWSGLLEDGRHWRIRYRWGVLRLTADADPNTMSVFSFQEPEVLEERQIGDEFSGIIDLAEVKEILAGRIDLDSAQEEEG